MQQQERSVVPRDLDEKKRLWQLVFAVWVSFINAAAFSIGSYVSPIWRDSPYSFTQSDLAWIGSVNGIFVSFSLPTGFIYDRFGASVCLRIGALFALIGHGILPLQLYGYIPVNYFTLIFGGFFRNQAWPFFETGAFVTNLATFARDKGSILLVEESFGAAIMASWYVGFLDRDTKLLSILIPILAPTVVFAASFFIARPTIDEVDIPWHGHKRFVVAYTIVATSLIFYTTTDLVGNFVDFSDTVLLVFAIIGVVLVLAYILLPITLNGRGYKEPNSNMSFVNLNILDEVEDDNEEDPQSWHQGQLDGPGLVEGEGEGSEKNPLIQQKEEAEEGGLASASPKSITLWKAVKTPEIWFLFIISCSQWGVCGMINSNRPQIYQALNNGNLEKKTNALYISVASIFNSVGRAFVAILDARTKNKSKILMLAPPVIGLAALSVVILPLEGLVFSFVLSGFGDSLSWAARALVLKQLFNGPHFGKIYNFMFSLAVFSPFIFNLGIFATLYDQKTTELTGSDKNICPERSCITTAMLIGLGVSIVASVAAVVLYRRNEKRLRRMRKER